MIQGSNNPIVCPFCNQPDNKDRMIFNDDLIMVLPTNIPITPGHLLICPVRHVGRIDELTAAEFMAIKEIVIRLKASLAQTFKATGFNLAWNEGESAGQSIDHLHVHLVPRQAGDSGIYNYEPRQFLYRPGSRAESPEQELIDLASLIKKNMEA